MNNYQEHKTFIFNNKIDKDLLFSLYEDDFAYMEEIFSITLTQLKPDIAQLESAFESADLSQIRKLVHKIKPSFGFVGLPQTQELCKQFEDKSAGADDLGQIKEEYIKLCERVNESVSIIEIEYQKFKDYNRPTV